MHDSLREGGGRGRREEGEREEGERKEREREDISLINQKRLWSIFMCT